MKKDVIYIDTEDDITSIIGKVKAADAKIVALVPPKRVGVLQSIVNLKLLQRSAKGIDKRVVLITNDKSLTALAAGVKMPVAKNLQSRPEVAEINALEVDNEDVINGEELPVGEIAAAAGMGATAVQAQSVADQIGTKIDLKDATPPASPVRAGLQNAATAAKPKKTGGPKIPNFETFRKKIFLFGGIGVAVLLFLIWAIFFAPKATITISAKTNAINIDRNLTLDPALNQSDIPSSLFKSNNQQLKKSASVDFDATGSKETGQQASGQVTVKNCEYSDGFSISSGTTFTAGNGLQFKSTQAVSVPGFSQVSKCNTATATVNVQAATFGPEYNLGAQNYSIAGVSGDVTATGSAMSGGSKETVTVVSAADVEKAKQQLTKQDTNAAKEELAKQFTGDVVIIAESFAVNEAAPNVSPAVNEPAKKAKLTVETTFTQSALARSEVKTLLDDYLKLQLSDKPDQSVYSNGENNLKFSQFQPTDGAKATVKLITTGYVGAKIDTKQLAEQLKGKRYGEIEQIVNTIPGVTKTDIRFSPFWVTRAPGANKIEIKFSVLNDGN